MNTAAQRLAAFSSSLTLDAIPQEVVEAEKLHILDTLGCGLAAHALDTAPAAREAMTENGDDRPGDRDRGRRRPARRGRGAGQRRHLPRARLRRYAHRVDRPRQRRGRAPRRWRRRRRRMRRAPTSSWPRSPATRSSPAWGWWSATRSTRAGSTPPRSAGCSAPPPRRRGCRLRTRDRDQRPRYRRQHGRRACLEYLADGSSTKRLHPGWAAHSGIIASRLAAHGATGPVVGVRGPLRALRRVRRSATTSRSTRSPPTSASAGRHRGSRSSRTPPATTCTPRSTRPRRRSAETPSPSTRSRRSSRSPPRRASRWCSSRWPTSTGRARSTRRSSACPYSVAALLLRGKVDVSTYTDQAITDRDVLELAPKVRYEVKEYETFPARAARRRAHPHPRRPGARGRAAVSARRPREPDERRRGPRQVPHQRLAGARPWRRSNGSRRRS